MFHKLIYIRNLVIQIKNREDSSSSSKITHLISNRSRWTSFQKNDRTEDVDLSKRLESFKYPKMKEMRIKLDIIWKPNNHNNNFLQNKIIRHPNPERDVSSRRI